MPFRCVPELDFLDDLETAATPVKGRVCSRESPF